MTPAEKARAAGLDERTIRLAYASFDIVAGRAAGEGRLEDAAAILDAHRRVMIYASVHDAPPGFSHFPMFGAGCYKP